MEQFEMSQGARKVIATSNDGKRWSVRLYVNYGETVTLIAAQFTTRKGAEKWAQKALTD